MASVCLIVVFNHQYNENIPKLRRIYGKRFSKIQFLVPFYAGDDPDTIPVYECSYQWQGYFIQACEKLLSVNTDWYLIIGDDVILSPEVNERNFEKLFCLDQKKQCFIHSIAPINGPHRFYWTHLFYAPKAFLSRGTMWQPYLPTYDEAVSMFRGYFDLSYSPEYNEEFFVVNGVVDEQRKKEFLEINGGSYRMLYPLAMGYSDVFTIRRENLYRFSHLCGVFSAMNLFVEMAIPTSMVLMFERGQVSYLSDTDFNSKLEWDDKEYFENIGDEYGFSFEDYYRNWDESYLFIHPIKLSKWRV